MNLIHAQHNKIHAATIKAQQLEDELMQSSYTPSGLIFFLLYFLFSFHFQFLTCYNINNF